MAFIAKKIGQDEAQNHFELTSQINSHQTSNSTVKNMSVAGRTERIESSFMKINNSDTSDADIVNQQHKQQQNQNEVERANAQQENRNELTFQDLKYNFWPIKLLTVIKFLPTEMNKISGKLRKKEKENFLDKILYRIWNVFAVVRIISIVLTIIYSRIYSEHEQKQGQEESDQNSDTQVHRFLLPILMTTLAIGGYLGYYKSIVVQMPTFTTAVNEFIRILRRSHQIQSETQNQDQINQTLRICRFFISLLKRPFQINLLIYLPFLMYSMLPAFLMLAILDHNLPVFLISFAFKPKVNSAVLKIFLYSILAVFDCAFYFFISSMLYYGAYIMLLGIIVIQQETGNAIEKLKSPNGLEEARKSLQLIKLLILIYNLVGSTVVYMAKLITLVAAIIGGFGAIKMMNSSPLFAVIYLFFFVTATVVHTSLFDQVYRIPEKMEELKEKIIIRAQNTNFRNESTKEAYKKICRSVQRLGIQAGGFYVMERETTLIFGDFVVQKIVDLLLTFT